MIETRRLKNIVIFIQTVVSAVLSRKIKFTFPVLFRTQILTDILLRVLQDPLHLSEVMI